VISFRRLLCLVSCTHKEDSAVKIHSSLSAPNLLNEAKNTFDTIPDRRRGRSQISLTDCLMSGLAIFGLKYPSLLQFDQGKAEASLAHNLKTLYQINHPPSDTYLRERLDEIAPHNIRKSFKRIFSLLQRGKHLEQFSYLDGHYLISVDGTGYFNSTQIHCDSCCVKTHRNGTKSYYHHMLGAVLVHPGYKEVIPLPTEPIEKQDGHNKNDCEQTAAIRLLNNIRREHPHLKMIVVEDSLYATGPHIQSLKQLNMRFIIGAKQYAKDFNFFDKELIDEHSFTDEAGVKHEYKFVNGVPLNGANLKLKVNMLDYYETSPQGDVRHFTWITDLALNKATVHKVMKGGRARWKIENETFNTLKNQGYHFEHNFGHGYQYLSTVFANLMLLAFLIDQVQQLCCKLFQSALAAAKSKTRFWEKVRTFALNFDINTWEDLYCIIAKTKRVSLQLDTT
jgi:hypothetical protein